MVVAVLLLIRTYQQLYAVIKSGKCVFFTCDYIDSYDGTSKKNCNKLSAIFFHLAKLLSKYVSDHMTFIDPQSSLHMESWHLSGGKNDPM